MSDLLHAVAGYPSGTIGADGSQSRSECCEAEKNFLPLQVIDSRSSKSVGHRYTD
jgi:hypothetical protein